MRHFTTRLISALFISLLVIVSACQKKSELEYVETNNSQDFVTEAKAWFANGPVSREEKLLNLPTTVLPANAPQRIFARMGKLQKSLIWENAQHYNNEGLEFLVVPINKKLKPYGDNYERASAIVFHKLQNNEMMMNVIEVLSKKDKSINGKSNEIIVTAFLNRVKNKKQPMPDADVNIFFYNEAYRNIGSYESTNGLLTSSKTSLNIRNTASITNNIAVEINSIESEGQNCVLWGVFLETRDENGNLISSLLLFTYSVCTGGNSGQNNEQFPDGQSSGGEDDPWEEGDAAKFADLDWTAFDIPASFGGGIVLSKDRFVGRMNSNKPERNKFISGGGHLGTNVYYNDFNGQPAISIFGVTVNSSSQATAKCGGSVGFSNGTPNVSFNSTKIVSFSQLSWQ